MSQKQAITKEVAKRYKKSTKKEKAMMLDEFVATTGYDRSYAARTLRQKVSGSHNKRINKRVKPRVYDAPVLIALTRIWAVLDMPCGKRLVAVIPEMIDKFKQFDEIKIDESTEEKLCKISAATIDRLLEKERKKTQLKARSGTKPGTLLKHQISIRTFADWDELKPGFVEIDLVAHNGGNPSGDFCQSLDVTDICSGWTETRAVKNKAQVWVFAALKDIRSTLPFDLLGIDSDNGGEFINHHLVRYCESEKITFTRSRPGRKNDNCFIEQKNYSIVRKTVGYMRHDTQKELVILNEMYGLLRFYTNFFQPSMKLIEKIRVGSKIKKMYDAPKTPYKRLLESPDIDEQAKADLAAAYKALNPAQLKRQIIKLQSKLFEANLNKKNSTGKEASLPELSSTF